MAEWQLPKLHTRVRFPSPAPFLGALAALAFLCAACSGITALPILTQRLLLIPVQPPLADLDGTWSQVHETDAGYLRVKAVNSVQDLHLRFATDDPGLQQQFSGQYGQALTLWFAGPRSGHGLRIDFKPKASFALNAEPLDTVNRVVTLLGPAAEGYPKAWGDGDDGIELSAVMSSGALVYEVRVPLKAAGPGLFGLDVLPGEALSVSIASAYLDPLLIEQTQVADPDSLGAGQNAGGNPYFLRHREWDTGPVDPNAPNGTYTADLRLHLAAPGPS